MAVTDAIIEQCGPIGKYQLFQLLVVYTTVFNTGQQFLVPTFHNFEPKHRCALPGWINDTYEIQSDLHNQTLIDYNITDSCHVNGTECTEFVYSKERYTGETIVTKFNLVCSKTKLATISTTVFTATLIFGVFICGTLADKIGRRWTLIGSLALSFIGSVAVIFSLNYIMYVVLRCWVGSTIIGATLVASVTVLENTGPTQRHNLAVLKCLFMPLGICSLSLVAYLLPDWNHIQIVITVVSALNLLIVFIFMRETPQFLLSKHRVDEARETLQNMARWNGRKVNKQIFENLNEEAGNVKKEKLKQILKAPTLIKRFIIFLFLWFVPGLGYYGMSFNVKNMSGDLFINNLSSAGVEILQTIPIWLTSRLGRKPPYITCMFIGSIALFAFAGLNTIEPNSASENVQLFISLVGRLGLTVVFTLNYFWTVEVFPTSLRSTMTAICSVFARIGMISSPFIADLYKYVDTALGTGLGPLIFAVLMLPGGILAFFLPETNRMRIPETIQEANIYLTKGHVDEFRETSRESSLTDLNLDEEGEDPHMTKL